MKNSKEMNFNQLFRQISPEEICDYGNVFTLVGKDFFAITAGKEDNYNSMVGSGGGFGTHFKKPSTWCIVKTGRYTLDFIEKEQTYTLSYFSDQYKKKMLFLGNKSGRNTDKMKDVQLTGIKCPSGNMSFKETRLIIECKVTQITTPFPDDFYSQEAIDYINETYKNQIEYRKYIFGEITNVWVKHDDETSKIALLEKEIEILKLQIELLKKDKKK